MDSFFVGKNRGQKRFSGNNQTRVCRNFQHGKCTYGDGCRFSHDTKQRAGVKRPRGAGNQEEVSGGTKKSTVKGRVCKNHLNGGCKWGDKCKFMHKETTRKQQARDKQRRDIFPQSRVQNYDDNNDDSDNNNDDSDSDSDSDDDEAEYRRRRDPGPAPGDTYPSDVSSSSDEEYGAVPFVPTRRRDPGPAPPPPPAPVDSYNYEDSNSDSNSDDAAVVRSGSRSEEPADANDARAYVRQRLEQAAAKSAAAPILSDDSEDSEDSSSSDDSSDDGESSGDEVMGARVKSRRAFGSKGIGMPNTGAGSNVRTWQGEEPARYQDDDSDDKDDDSDDNDDLPSSKKRKTSSSSSSALLRKSSKHQSTKKSRHAPAEMSSKRAVSRYRVVVPDSEVSAYRKRDPRFDNLSGKLNRGHWETAYEFIDDYKKDELSQLRAAVQKTKDLEKKATIEQELSRELNRVSERDQWKQQRAVVQEHRRKEKKAIADGKKSTPYHLSRQGLKKATLEKKFETLKKKGKLDKYMEKRRKKNAMKDRRRLPQNFH